MKKTTFREFEIKPGVNITLGKDEISNDELMKKFRGKRNTIVHTSSPGSPFGVIEKLNPLKSEIETTSAIVASYSQDWRDNKKDTSVDVFTGKDISKGFFMKAGTWKVKKSKKIKIKKSEIEKAIKKFRK